MAVKIIKISNRYEFDEMVKEKDFRISKAIVEGILENLNSKRKYINVLTIDFIEENQYLDITLEKRHFSKTLEENLIHYENQELYEECEKIQQTIKQLKEKQL